jgi:fission process protein 1
LLYVACTESAVLLCGAAIPFIVHPIDNTIHALLNATMRPAMRKYVCGPGQGALADLDMCADCKLAAEESSPGSSNGTH